MADETSAQSPPESDNQSENSGGEEENLASGAQASEEMAKNNSAPIDQESESSATPSLREPFPFGRLALAVVFGCLAAVASWFLVVFAVLQFVTIAIAGQKNSELQHFSRLTARYVQEAFDYMTLTSDVQPFPLGPFPKE